MTEEPMVAAYCHPDEVDEAQRRVDYSVDRGAVVKPHPWMHKGEVIICHPAELPPIEVAQRHLLEIAHELTLADIIRKSEELKVDYRV